MLAFVRADEEQQVLIVANLSQHVQPVELARKLAGEAGKVT